MNSSRGVRRFDAPRRRDPLDHSRVAAPAPAAAGGIGSSPGTSPGRASVRARARWTPRTAVILMAAAGLVVSGCSLRSPVGQEAAVVALPTATPQALAPYYGQKPAWHPCTAPGFDCATMKAPLDYGEPGSGNVKLAVARKRATGPGKRIGSLLVNPGGPGGSAIEYLKSYAALGYPAEIRARYDIVAIDPRGVAQSEPVTCMSGKQMDAFTQTDVTPDDGPERDRLVRSFKAFAAGCEKRSARMLPHVSTVEAARDMDILRAVLGDRKLTYVGASYGTFLGATYAGLYPTRVGRLVLDGAMDPSLTARGTSLGQTVGFETAFRAFAEDCAKRSDCPLGHPAGPRSGADTSTSVSAENGPPDAGAKGGAFAAEPVSATGYRRNAVTGRVPRGTTTPADVSRNLQSFFRQLDRTPMATDVHGSQGAERSASEHDAATRHGGSGGSGGRKLGEALATTAVIAAMYDEAAWPQLRDALTSAIRNGDGSGLLALSDSYYERAGSGRYTNLMFANAAVNCLDLPPAFTSPDQVRKALPDFEKASPVFGDGLAWAALSCAYWPVRATGRPDRITAKGAAPILVVGTTRDPATPYTWARSLAAQLDSARLLTYDGDGHTAYGRGSTCIDTTINHYLLTGTSPADGKRCS